MEVRWTSDNKGKGPEVHLILIGADVLKFKALIFEDERTSGRLLVREATARADASMPEMERGWGGHW